MTFICRANSVPPVLQVQSSQAGRFDVARAVGDLALNILARARAIARNFAAILQAVFSVVSSRLQAPLHLDASSGHIGCRRRVYKISPCRRICVRVDERSSMVRTFPFVETISSLSLKPARKYIVTIRWFSSWSL